MKPLRWPFQLLSLKLYVVNIPSLKALHVQSHRKKNSEKSLDHMISLTSSKVERKYDFSVQSLVVLCRDLDYESLYTHIVTTLSRCITPPPARHALQATPRTLQKAPHAPPCHTRSWQTRLSQSYYF